LQTALVTVGESVIQYSSVVLQTFHFLCFHSVLELLRSLTGTPESADLVPKIISTRGPHGDDCPRFNKIDSARVTYLLLLRWKSSVTYSECVFVALGIEPAIRMGHIVICGLHGSAVFFHNIP
jgi:hypothetical protein